MGNGHHRYFTNSEAIEVIGGEVWAKLRYKLEKNNHKSIDYAVFSTIIKSRFERMPNVLCESIYRAFASDLTLRIDVDSFMSALAVIGSENNDMILKFIFRVYENERGVLERRKIEDMLHLAYGEKLRSKLDDLNEQLDLIFDRGVRREVTTKDFERYEGNIELFVAWIARVLKVFVEPLPKKMIALERKYSSSVEAEELMRKFRISKLKCDQLRELFLNNCSPAASAKAELDLHSWCMWVSCQSPQSASLDSSANGTKRLLAPAMLTVELSSVIFQSKVETYKPVWRLIDFTEFCVVFGVGKLEDKVNALCSAFIHFDSQLPKVQPFKSESRQWINNHVFKGLIRMILYLLRPVEVYVSNGADENNDDNDLSDNNNKYILSVSSGIASRKRGYSLNHGDVLSETIIKKDSMRDSINVLGQDCGMGNSNDEMNEDMQLSIESTNDLLFLLIDKTVIPHVILSILFPNSLVDAIQEPRTLKSFLDDESNHVGFVDRVKSALINHRYLFPGIRDLSITACCLFGVPPNWPIEEKEYVTELTVRYLKQYPQSSSNPYGPIGTEWCLISKTWYDGWRLFVGQKHNALRNEDTVELNRKVTQNSVGSSPPKPGYIDNDNLLQKNHTTSNPNGLSNPGAVKILMSGLQIGHDLEAIPPSVFTALQCWYGGGPRISRRVAQIVDDRNEDDSNNQLESNMKSSSRERNSMLHTKSELELYPICIRVCRCSTDGRTICTSNGPTVTPLYRQLLFSRNLSVQDVTVELCYIYQRRPLNGQNVSDSDILDSSKVRLWNYLNESDWKEQFILSPESALRILNIKDNQLILMEVSLADGTWPRSQLNSKLGQEEVDEEEDDEDETEEDGKRKKDDRPNQRPGARQSGFDTEYDLIDSKFGVLPIASAIGSSISSVAGRYFGSSNAPQDKDKAILMRTKQQAARILKRAGGKDSKNNDNNSNPNGVSPIKNGKRPKKNLGLVGLDNLGNTCYMNSSLQALAHTDQLVDYFFSKTYLQDVNVHNIHGYRGRLANTFGKLMIDMWTTKKNYIVPKPFFQEVAVLRDQFAGNEQHDAHELLAFLLDGLSEDLNLVQEKPYTEQPDSDGRPEVELANIWWENHLKRDRSVIQALFTGQFRSTMVCTNTEACCDYSSTRYEPFNFLTVPIPEELERVMVVIVIPLRLEFSTQCAVRVNKSNGTMADIIDKVLQLELEGVEPSRYSKKSSEEKNGPEVYFVAAELFNQRIKAFNTPDRRVENIRDSETLLLFQVRRPHHSSLEGSRDSNDKKDYSANSNSDINRSEAMKGVEEDSENVYNEEELFSLGDPLVRVAFCQRRVRLIDGMLLGTNGFDMFRLESFGLPILEVIPSRISGSDLYFLISSRIAPFLKAPVEGLVQYHNSKHVNNNKTDIPDSSTNNNINQTFNNNSDNSVEIGMISQNSDNNDDINTTHKSSIQSPSSTVPMPVSLSRTIRSVETDDVVGGAIPPDGFTLRFINGGSNSHTSSCSKCHWLTRCQGCVVPKRKDVFIELRDGETLSIDWHYSVFEDVLDTVASCRIGRHVSVTKESSSMYDTKIHLNQCLDKFTELESLEGVVCPKCHSDQHMKKSFLLWRQPPLLIIQLKRFQFDRTSRRKLNQCIDFPLDGLDLSDYIAIASKNKPSYDSDNRKHNQDIHTSNYEDDNLSQGQVSDTVSTDHSFSLTVSTNNNKNNNVGVAPSHSSHNSHSDCNLYDLYSVIHHVGVMGGGHYVTSVRQTKSSPTQTVNYSINNMNNNQVKNNNNIENNDNTGHDINGHMSPMEIGDGLNRIGSLNNIAEDPPSLPSQHIDVTSLSSPGPASRGPLPSLSRYGPEETEDKWFIFNDNIVTPVRSPSEVVSSSAYVLFYRRKDYDHNQTNNINNIRELLSKNNNNDKEDPNNNNNNNNNNNVNNNNRRRTSEEGGAGVAANNG
eukprot:gene4301-6097_t